MSEFNADCVVWISSLAENEQGLTQRILEDIRPLASPMGFEEKYIENKEDFVTCFKELTKRSFENGLSPILHFDMHGDKDKGLLISKTNEYISWQELIGYLRELNMATKNNLCVIGATCYSLYMIDVLVTGQVTPFYALIASNEEIGAGFLEDQLPVFYKELFESNNISDAHKKSLSDKFKLLTCKDVLFLALKKYIKDYCKGTKKAKRIERVLTEVITQHKQLEIKPDISEIRKNVKKGLAVDQKLLDKYVSEFLMGYPCGFKIEDILAKIRKEQEGYS